MDFSMDSVIDKAYRGLKVPLRAFYCREIGGGGRLRRTIQREEARKNIYIITNPVNGRSGVGS